MIQMSRTISAGYVYRQYSTEGVYIADYKSSRAAHEATGVSIGSIARAAHGERRTGGGYVWRKVLADSPKDSIEIDLISKIGNHDKRPLVQKNLDGEIVGEFLSIAHAGPLKSAAGAFPVRSAGLRRQPGATYGKRRWRMISRFRGSRLQTAV
jgi:hypothetical protein